MTITSIRIEGYRSLKDVTLEPGPITVLIGANGAGKSNVLGALRLLTEIQRGFFRVAVAHAAGASSLLHYGSETTRELAFHVAFAGPRGAYAYRVRLDPTIDDALSFVEETVIEGNDALTRTAYALGAGHRESQLNAERPPSAAASAVREVVASLQGIRSFHFHNTSDTAPLRVNSRQVEDRELHANGGNLAAYLYRLSRSTADSYVTAWRRINMLVRRVAPFIQELAPTLVAPEIEDRSAVRLDWIDTTGARFRSHQLSDGTIRAIALFTALGQPAETLPSFITLDEPELGLHPAAIALLAGMIRSVSAQSQILVATQSPELLDAFAPDEVVVTDREGGQTTLTRLSTSDLEVWLERYTMSEIWRKNLVGGRP